MIHVSMQVFTYQFVVDHSYGIIVCWKKYLDRMVLRTTGICPNIFFSKIKTVSNNARMYTDLHSIVDFDFVTIQLKFQIDMYVHRSYYLIRINFKPFKLYD